ncbi:MAG: ATP-binding protein [Bacteroidia bacterium]
MKNIILTFSQLNFYLKMFRTGLVSINFILQFLALILISFRGKIFDFLSIVVANSFSITGLFFCLYGIKELNNQSSKKLFNILLLVIHFILYFYLYISSSSIEYRNIFYSVFSNIFIAQIIYEIIINGDSNFKKLAKPLFVFFSIFFVLNLARIVKSLLSPKLNIEYLNIKGFEIFVLLMYGLLFLLICIAFILYVNNKLLYDINIEQEKFTKTFYLNPQATLLTRLSDGLILQVNKGFENLIGFNENYCIKKTTLDIKLWLNDSDRENYKNKILENNGSIHNYEIKLKKADETEFWAKLSSNLIEVNNEKNIITIIEDITETKQLLLELTNTKLSLQKSNNEKDKFFSILAHDLRAPFTQVNSLVQLLKSDINEKSYKEVNKELNLILKASDKALIMLNNLLEWTRLKRGKIEFNPVIFSLISSVNDVLNIYNFDIENKNLGVKLDYEKSFDIKADRNMIESILRNLLSNAIKFTPRGGNIVFNIKKCENWTTVCVKDTGVGISKDRMDKLFDLGIISTRGTENEEGTGLGLVISKEFVEKHGGKIWVNSTLGVGSEFCFSIPNN